MQKKIATSIKWYAEQNSAEVIHINEMPWKRLAIFD